MDRVALLLEQYPGPLKLEIRFGAQMSLNTAQNGI